MHSRHKAASIKKRPEAFWVREVKPGYHTRSLIWQRRGKVNEVGFEVQPHVGASLLAMNVRATRAFRWPALSLTSIASELAPTGGGGSAKVFFG